MLVLISMGIFISCFHSHSDLRWHHSEQACPTGTHISIDTSLCPICDFRLDGTPVEAPSLTAVQTVSSIIVATEESVVDETFNGQLNGRSPPSIV